MIILIIAILLLLFIICGGDTSSFNGGFIPQSADTNNAKKPQPRPYNRQIINTMGGDKADLKIMTQNVLADSFTMPSFRHVPEWIRAWDQRKVKLIAEYAQYIPDIIALQELDKCDELLSGLNEKINQPRGAPKRGGDEREKPPINIYEAIYTQRGGNLVDGTGIFFNTATTSKVEEHVIDYNKGAMMGEDDQFNCRGLIAVFIHKATGKKFIVATTHHHWDPKRLEVKHKQVELLLFEVANIRKAHPETPVFIAGDFNFAPTGVCPDIPVDYSPYEKMIAKYKSAYNEILGHEPDFTSVYKRGERHTHTGDPTCKSTWPIDYIFYDDAIIQGVLEIPTLEKTTAINWRGIPNTVYGSDHFSLMATFKL